MSGPNAPPMNQLVKMAGQQRFPAGLPSDTADYGSPPIQARTLPRAAPRPAPQPASRPQQAPQSVTAQPAQTSNTSVPPEGTLPPPGQVPLPQPRAAVAATDTFYPPSNADALRAALEKKAAQMRGEVADPTQAQAPPQPQVTTRDIAQAQVAANPDAMKFSYQQPKPADAGSGDFPRAVPKNWYVQLTKGEAPVRATINPAILDRAMAAAKECKKFSVPHLTEKTQTNKEGKESSMYLYKALGVEPGDKRGMSQAISKLQQKAATAPWLLTPLEDKILASASKSEGFHRSMEPEAVKGRQAEAQTARAQSGEIPELELPGSSGMKFTKPSFDPAATTVEQFIQSGAAPTWQGNKFPTQADVKAAPQAPIQFKERFQTYQPPPSQAEADPETTDEEGDD